MNKYFCKACYDYGPCPSCRPLYDQELAEIKAILEQTRAHLEAAIASRSESRSVVTAKESVLVNPGSYRVAPTFQHSSPQTFKDRVRALFARKS